MTQPSSDPGFPVLITGLPASGKTTFLAALWHVVANSAQSRFAVHSFVGNREYVQLLEQSWLSGTQLPRTPREHAAQVAMNVEDRQTGNRYAISLPDLSGEDFLKFFSAREWPETIDDLVQDTAGVIVFVNPEYVVRPTTLVDVVAAAAAAGPSNVGGVAATDAPKATIWDPEKCPTAVVLVDLLAAMSDRRGATTTPLRVALVVSAWDTMQEHGMSPEDWAKRDLSLLHQFLLTNPDRFSCHVYGVSAQGGDVTDPATRSRLLAMADATDRIEVSGIGVTGNDLSAPIAWVAE
jgi:hypothetical protein